MKIAFIGLGNMGLPMAINLAEAGHAIGAFDVSPDARGAADGAGLSVGESASEVAAGAEVAITMLPKGEIAAKVAEDMLGAMVPDGLLIDCSTIDVDSARGIHAKAEALGHSALDAPVSGGVGGAEAGSLTFMVGGNDEAVARAAPLFEVMGARHVHCGGAGAGQAAKICNNMLLAVSMVGTAEAFGLAEKLGLDAQRLYDVVSTSSGACWSVTTYCPVPGVGPTSPADNGYEPGFAVDLMAKDAGLAMEAADTIGAATPLGKHATDIYRAMQEAGRGGEDFSSVINHLRQTPRGG
ncbi:MAG: 3-hydroxyisobutyrate dehydrogenase [Pseudomonadota bacterium]